MSRKNLRHLTSHCSSESTECSDVHRSLQRSVEAIRAKMRDHDWGRLDRAGKMYDPSRDQTRESFTSLVTDRPGDKDG